MKTYKEAVAVTPQQLQQMTPPQVDELLGAVDQMMAAAWHRKSLAQDRIVIEATGDRRRGRGSLPFSEALTKVSDLAHKDPTGPAADVLNDLKKAAALVDAVAEVEGKFEAEFHRRGGWTRSFLVTDGHAHRTNRCSTCHRGGKLTPMHRFFEYSGMDEAEIVKRAGDRACTVCYPSAPVAKGLKAEKSVMLTPEERERAKVREEEAARREEKRAKAAVNAITLPDGTPLREEMGRDGQQRGSIVKTLRTARSTLGRQLWYQYAWDDKDGAHERNIQHLARAVAWKENGLAIGAEPTEDEIQAVIEPLRNKAVKEVDKARRDAR